MPAHLTVLYSSLHPTTWEKERKIPEDVVFDRVAILSTRGYANIYHNSEWIMNFIHYADVERLLPLVGGTEIIRNEILKMMCVFIRV